jgi:hypothetical protein
LLIATKAQSHREKTVEFSTDGEWRNTDEEVMECGGDGVMQSKLPDRIGRDALVVVSSGRRGVLASWRLSHC